MSIEYPEYYPAQPYTLIIDSPADPEMGHEFVLHFDIEEERYNVFFFEDRMHADQVKAEYEQVAQKRAQVVRFDPRAVEERFGVRYTDASGKQTDMGITDYRRNMEFKNEFRRDD